MLKAIIVDDEKWARSIIRTFGQWDKLGIDIVGEAEDGLEGLNLIEKWAPDIVITDMEMSNMDGIVFLKTIKEKSIDTKIIVISGHDNFAYMKQAIHSQAVEYILKPIDAEELNQALEKCIKELALTKNISTLALHDLFDQEVIEEIIDVTKSFRSILRGTDSLKVMPLLSQLKKKFRNIHQEQGVLVRLIHDYFVPIIRDEMMDALKNSTMFQTLFEQLRLDVTRGLILEEYFQKVEKLMITGIDYRCHQIRTSEKPVAEFAKEYVDNAYKEDISLSDVAERFFISKEYLSSTFKSHFGITLGNYILRKKMEEAAYLLSEGVSHKDISDQLGYNDVTYFYKVFKRYYGCTPGEYGN